MNSAQKNEILVAIALVRRGDCWLVGERTANQALAGCAEFPGGKCLPGETPEECAQRECHEETGLEVTVLRRRREVEHEYPHGRLRLVFCDCELKGEEPPRPPFRWAPRSELATLRFPEANAGVLSELMREGD